MTDPTAPIVKARPNPDHPGAWVVKVLCPYACGRHSHGVPEVRADGIYGPRAPHCRDDRTRPGYTITDPDGILAAAAGLGRRSA